MSEIEAERCIGGTDLTEPRLSPDGRLLVYASSTAGVAALVVHECDTGVDYTLATSPGLRPGRGLGGGAWTLTPDGASVVYVAADGNLWRQPVVGGPATQLTEHGPDRAATGPCVAPDGVAISYVLDLAEVHLLDVATGQSHRIDDGSADFCMDPFVDADSITVRWLVWNVPDMAWDRSRVQVYRRPERDGEGGGRVSDEATTDFAVQQPRSLPDGTPMCVRDDGGWLNVWAGDRPLVEERYEHAGPSWGPGQRSYAWSPDSAHVAFTRNEGGFGRLCVIERATGEVREVARGVHGQLSWCGNRLAAVRTGARTPTQVVWYDTVTWERTVVAVGPAAQWADDELREPQLVQVPVVDGVLHARLYRADNNDGRMIVWLHGGPTDQWQVTFMPRIAFWMSRGWSILVPDHRGSTGHGRAYQQALRGRWGELDVADTLAVTRHAHAAGWAQPERTAVFGGSAGGFTALGAVAAEPGLFVAAVLLYPVSDLVELAELSHRFERHYTHHLVGPLPDSLVLYRHRSPTYHAHRYARTPLLLLHGDEDAVVPVRQSTVFAHRVRAAGGDVQLHVYPGEGHGFRIAANQLDEYRRAEGFLAHCIAVASGS